MKDYIPTNIYGFYFSSNADRSANDYCIYVDSDKEEQTVTLAPRYKNSGRNHLYEMTLDPDDLILFGKMCSNFGEWMKSNNRETK